MDEVYQGLQQGRPIEFSRVFRGHRFTDRECETLVQGSCIAVHNIHGKRGVYAVEGKLIYDEFWKKWKFDTVRMIPNQVDYDFEKQSNHDIYHVDTSMDDVVELNDDDLIGISFDEIRSEIQHMPSVKLSPLKELTASLSQELRRETGYVTKSDIAMDVVVSEEPLQDETKQETAMHSRHGLTRPEPSVKEPMSVSQELTNPVTNTPMQSSDTDEIGVQQEGADVEDVQDNTSREFVSDIDEDSDDGFAIMEDTDALDEMSEEDWISFLQESEETSHHDTDNDDEDDEDDDEDFYGDVDPYEGMDELFMDELSDNLTNSSYGDVQFDAELDAMVSDTEDTDDGAPVSVEPSLSSDFDDADFDDTFDE